MIKKILDILKYIWAKVRAFFPWYKSLYKGRAWYTKTALVIVSVIVSLFLYLGMVDMNFLWLFGKSPGFREIKTPPTYDASLIYSADSVLIGKFFKENRIPVQYKDVNPVFWKALIDTEDERFYDHHGIDFKGIAGAVKDAVTSDARGASTITQQLAKNLFRVRSQYSTGLLGKIPGIKMLIMKSKEWILAIKLEMVYDKDEILTMYANTVDFGNNSFGINTAAKTYFNTTPAKLTAEQAATLVGMLKATTHYNPISHPENSLKRRNVVLYNMVEHGDLSRSEYELLSQKPLGLDVQVEDNYDGQALYFREYIATYLKDWCEDNGYDLYSSGLTIYTTLDTRLQKYAEQAATKQMRQVQQNFRNHWGKEQPWRDENGQLVPNFIEKIAQHLPVYKSLTEKFPNNPDSVDYYMNKPHKVRVFDYEKGSIEREMSTMDSIRYMVSFMHCSFLAMEPESGAVRAWVGDVDFESWKYDKVTAMRQPGS
ncbi:MAG: transglycosylase domain-containing protein, partial [Prevotella sp.]|nr:transglycosylase domain-containing protein [Prevotella sp.]